MPLPHDTGRHPYNTVHGLTRGRKLMPLPHDTGRHPYNTVHVLTRIHTGLTRWGTCQFASEVPKRRYGAGKRTAIAGLLVSRTRRHTGGC